MKVIVLALLLLGISNSYAQLYYGPDKTNWPQSESSKVKDDFAAWVLVTPDKDWLQKWSTPADTMPVFNETKTVKRGGWVFILPFFASPKVNDENKAHVLCSMRVHMPDGTLALEKKDVVCLQGEPTGGRDHVRLSPTYLQYYGDYTDQLGIWKVEVTVNDVVRGTVLNLKTEFVLIE